MYGFWHIKIMLMLSRLLIEMITNHPWPYNNYARGEGDYGKSVHLDINRRKKQLRMHARKVVDIHHLAEIYS